MLRVVLGSVVLLLTASFLCAADPLPPGAVARFGALELRDEGLVTAVAFSPDGRTLITGGWGGDYRAPDGRLVFWDTATGRPRQRLDLQTFLGVDALAVSPCGRYQAIRHDGKSFRLSLVDARASKVIRTISADGGWALAFAPDGEQLAYWLGGSPALIRIQDTATGRQERVLECSRNAANRLAFSPDGKLLAAAGVAERLRLWDVETGEELYREAGPHDTQHTLCFSPDGRRLALCGPEKSVVLWDVAGKRVVQRFPLEQQADWIAFTPDGKSLLARQECGLFANPARLGPRWCRAWDTETGKLQFEFEVDRGGAELPALSPDGRTLAAPQGHGLRRWDITLGREIAAAPGHTAAVDRVAVSSDGRQAASAGRDGFVRLWQLRTGAEVRAIPFGTRPCLTLAFAPDGRRILAGVADRLLAWDAGTGAAAGEVPIGSAEFFGLALSTDVRTLVGIRRGQNGTLFRFDVTQKERPKTLSVDTLPGAVACSPDGLRFATGEVGSIALWDATGKREPVRLKWPDVTCGPVAFSPDGRLVAAAAEDGALRIWNVSDGRTVRLLRGAGHPASALAFTPDGRTLLVANGADRSGKLASPIVRGWEIASGLERVRLAGHKGEVRALAVAPDGRSLITAGTDTTALVWSLPSHGDRAAARAADLPAIWDELAGADAIRAHSAMGALAAAPEVALTGLRERLRPLAPLDEKGRARAAAWIAELDSDDFATRERAAESLRSLEEPVRAMLREALAGKPTPGARRQLERLLEEVSADNPAGSLLRSVRAVELLEILATPDARKLLEEVAAGWPEARRTREAKEALERLKARK
jgi:WD40 repeat protein